MIDRLMTAVVIGFVVVAIIVTIIEWVLESRRDG